jgi:integrase
MSKSQRPLPVGIGDLSARVVRGPHPDGRWYWRWSRLGTGDADGGPLGWRTREEVGLELAKMVGTDGNVQGRPDVRTVRDLMETWAAAELARTDLSSETTKQRVHTAKTIVRQLGPVLLTQVTRDTLEGYRNRRLREHPWMRTTTRDGRRIERQLERTISPRTVRLELETFGTAWKWGRDVGAITNTLPRVTVKVSGWVRNRRTPSPAELERVLAELEQTRSRNKWARLALLLLWGTGSRRGESLFLRRNQIDLDEHVAIVKGKMGERRIPLAPELVAELREVFRQPAPADALILPVARHTALGFGTMLRRACKRAGVEWFNPGGCRRRAVRDLYRSTQPAVAASVLGHSPQVAIRNYEQVEDEERMAAVLAARLGPAAVKLREHGAIDPEAPDIRAIIDALVAQGLVTRTPTPVAPVVEPKPARKVLKFSRRK